MRFGRFNLVGLLGAALQLLLTCVLTKILHAPVVAATAAAVEIVVLHNFIWHERFTWPDRRVTGFSPTAIRLWRFHAGNGLVSMVGNTVLMYWLAERLKVPVVLSAIAAMAICSLANFLIANHWVYPRPRAYIRIKDR
jgi:putative flippase GtrA